MPSNVNNKNSFIKISSGKVSKNKDDIVLSGESIIDPDVFSEMAKSEGSEAKLIKKLNKVDNRKQDSKSTNKGFS